MIRGGISIMVKGSRLRRIAAAALIASAFSSCAAMNESAYRVPDDSEVYGAAGGAEQEAEQFAANIVAGNAARALNSELEDPLLYEPFAVYTFEYMYYSDKYLITVEPDEIGASLLVTAEDSQLESTSLRVWPPAGYSVTLPPSQSRASDVCVLLKNTVDLAPVPEIIQFDFYKMTTDTSLPFKLSRFYAISKSDGTMTQIKIRDDVSQTPAVPDHVADASLRRTEVNKFMEDPEVFAGGDGAIDAVIYTYAFDPDRLVLTREREPCGMDNILYYGYYTRAVADELYRYFSVDTLNISDYGNYAEVYLPNGDNDIFFKVDDGRFSTVAELRAYAKSYFSDSLVTEMFLNSPQKYTDINGELCTVIGSGGVNPLLGKLTITDFEVSGNTVLYKVRRERRDESGKTAGYIEGEFVIELTSPTYDTVADKNAPPGPGFRVIKY